MGVAASVLLFFQVLCTYATLSKTWQLRALLSLPTAMCDHQLLTWGCFLACWCSLPWLQATLLCAGLELCLYMRTCMHAQGMFFFLCLLLVLPQHPPLTSEQQQPQSGGW